MTRAQKIKTGQIEVKPLVFQFNQDDLKEVENELNSISENSLSQNGFQVESGRREFKLGKPTPTHTYYINVAKEGQDSCEVKIVLHGLIDKCSQKNEKENCLKALSACVDKKNKSEQKVEQDMGENLMRDFLRESSEAEIEHKEQNEVKNESSQELEVDDDLPIMSPTHN